MRVLTLALSLTLTSPAWAQPPVAVPIEYNGREGVWFSLEEAQRLNALDANTGNRQREVRLLERQLELAAEVEIPSLQRAVRDLRQIGGVWRGVVDSATERANSAESRLDSIWNQPLFWLALGLAVGGIVGGFLVSR